MAKPFVSIMIPAVNEGSILGKLIKDCLRFSNIYRLQIVVVTDTKTTNQTTAAGKKAGAEVINIGKGRGKGTAFRKSLPYLKGDYIVQIDADYQFQPKQIPQMVKPLLDGYDVTLGTRYQKGADVEEGSVTPLRLFGSYFLSAVTTIFAHQRITDVMAGFKAFKKEALFAIKPKTDHFGYEAELVIKAAKKHFKIQNVPIQYKKRVTGATNVSTIKHGILVLRTILETGMR